MKGGHRRHDRDVGNLTINTLPNHRKRPSSITDPLLGHVFVAFDDMELNKSLLTQFREIDFYLITVSCLIAGTSKL